MLLYALLLIALSFFGGLVECHSLHAGWLDGKLLGVTGPTTLLLLCVPLRMSWVCRRLWVSGIQLGFLQMAALRNFKRRRQTELKHGRISMLATMGYITPEITGKFPGYLSPSAGLKFADVPNGLAAISKVPAAGWGQILAYMAFCEVSQDQSAGTPAAAGDFGWKLITSTDPEVKKTKLNAELANGRLAMMAIIGMFFQVMGEW